MYVMTIAGHLYRLRYVAYRSMDRSIDQRSHLFYICEPNKPISVTNCGFVKGKKEEERKITLKLIKFILNLNYGA